MNPEGGSDRLNSGLKEQDAVMETLHGTIADNKEASEGLKKALANLEGVAEKIEKEEG